MPQTRITAGERRLRASIAANTSWGNTTDRSARTQNGRSAAFERYFDGIDPTLPEDQRLQMALARQRAQMSKLAFESAKVRRIKNQLNDEQRTKAERRKARKSGGSK